MYAKDSPIRKAQSADIKGEGIFVHTRSVPNVANVAIGGTQPPKAHYITYCVRAPNCAGEPSAYLYPASSPYANPQASA